MTVRPLGPEDIEQVWTLSQLAFGYRSETPPSEIGDSYGIDDERGRLMAVARVRSYEQVWGGRRVPMGGIAGVVVHPDARGQGLASGLMRSLLPVMRAAGQAVSALFPTGVGVYRPLGWEVVGSLDDTRIATRDLHPSHDGADVVVRSAGPADVPAIQELYDGLGVNGLLVRQGPEFPRGAEAVLDHDVVALARGLDETPLGYASYSRGTGYREGSELRVWECINRTAPAAASLLRSLASWSTVAPTVLWRGPTTELRLHVAGPVPPPTRTQPWMLRVVDAPAAIGGRGFPPGVDIDLSFVLHDPDSADNSRAWRLRVTGGRGSLEPAKAAEDMAVLHVRGLALLYASSADVSGLVRVGLLDRRLEGLDTAFAGQPARILDYF